MSIGELLLENLFVPRSFLSIYDTSVTLNLKRLVASPDHCSDAWIRQKVVGFPRRLLSINDHFAIIGDGKAHQRRLDTPVLAVGGEHT